MKEKRQCSNNMNYPMYQQPMMMPPLGYPMYQGGFQPNMMVPNMTGGISNNTFEQQLNNIEQQINLLDKRITRLEGLNNNLNNKYNDSNYYMV